MNKRFLICGVATLLVLISYVFFKNDNKQLIPSLEEVTNPDRSSRYNRTARSEGEQTEKAPRLSGGGEIYEEFKVRPFKQDKAKLNNDRHDPPNGSAFEIQAEDPKYTELDTVKSLEELLMTYRANIGGDYQSGSNIEITNALLGDNPRKIALLSSNSGRINEEGMLVDSYGTPYDFHFISMKRLIIRSAGEDLELYTEDDITSAREEELSSGVKMPGMDWVIVEP